MSDINELFVLPFDHRGSFMEEMFGILERPTEEDIDRVKFYKGIIYDGFKLAMQNGIVPQKSSAILVDEQFGDAIINDAKRSGYNVCICAEKSGQKEFDFEFGDDFKQHIEKYKPEYVKVLVRFNPDDDQDLNERQIEKLKILSDYCKESGYKLMLEPLVPPTPQQLDILDGDKDAFDQDMRPQLMELMIEEIQAGGVDPSVWKIEGLDYGEDYEMLIEQIRSKDESASIIILGRHASNEQVDTWLEEGAGVEGIIGFAVGRTIFWDPLVAYRDGEITAEAAAQNIADSFEHFYQVFKENQN